MPLFLPFPASPHPSPLSHAGPSPPPSHPPHQIQDDIKTFDFSQGSGFHASYTAFFADCEHEIKPVTAGLRLALTYNLLYKGEGQVPSLLHDRKSPALLDALQRWLADSRGPSFLIHILSHQYSRAGLSFADLKNQDRAACDRLRGVAEEAGVGVYLARLERRETGYDIGGNVLTCQYDEEEDDEYEGDYGVDYGRAEWEMDEVSTTLLCLLTTDGKDLFAGKSVSVEEDEVFLGKDMEAILGPAQREDFGGYLGNESATIDRTYSKAALIIIPNKNYLQVRTKGAWKLDTLSTCLPDA